MATKKYTKKSEQAKKVAASAQSIVIEQPNTHMVALEVTGVTDLIQNCFSQKTLEQMLRKHMGLSVIKEKKKPRELIEQAKILNTAGAICIPPVAFKKAMLTAATQKKGLAKTKLRPAIFVMGQSVPITYTECVPRMDMVRTAGIGRTPDIRFRPMFTGWKARLVLEFSEQFGVQTVVDLLNQAGKSGVGEWRPERDGTFGQFRVSRHISDEKEIAEVLESCSVPLVELRIPDWALDHDVDPQLINDLVKANKGGGKAA